MRHGQLQTADWSKLTSACAPLFKAPIFIDDTPSSNMMEIRAKARRLKSREPNLGLVIIDYLQPVSYTHLDVYKRQGPHRMGSLSGWCW